MELTELVQAVMSGNLLVARQWVADAQRAGVRWDECERPSGLDERAMAIAAALAELFAARAGTSAPSWTSTVAGESGPVYLDPGIETMPRTLKFATEHAPEPLRKRNLFAMPDFLDVR